MGVLKLVKSLNSISLEVDGSNLHPCGIGGSVGPKIALRARDPPDRILRGHLSPPSRIFSAPEISSTSSAVDDDFYTRSPASS
ncbi:hypothetical protein B296_00051959, partial [Ensete ventricosum]